MSRITRLFITNPRLIVVTLLMIVVAGLGALQTLPRMEDPRLANRWASVVTRYPGADAQRVEALVADPIENALLEVEEILTIESRSQTGVLVMQLELRDDVMGHQTDEVWSRVRDKLSDVSAELPTGVEDPVFDNEKGRTSHTMIAAVVWDHDGPVSRAVLNRLGEELEDALLDVPGTEYTQLFGAAQEEVLIDVEPADLAALGLSAADLAARIEAGDAKVAAGTLKTDAGEYQLEVSGEIDTLQRVRDLVLTQDADGRVVRLADIATVTKDVSDPPRTLAIIDDLPGVAVGARISDQTRIDQWTQRAVRVVDDFNADRSQAVRAVVLFNQNDYTNERLNGLVANFAMGVGLVVLTILFMMGWRSALLVASALPLSALIVLAAMRYLGVPIHQMSITGLIIALGLLIDNAIVMVDEVRKRLVDGETTTEAAVGAVKHLFGPLLGSTLTTVFAFLPIYLMPGGAGEFVGSIALGVILAVIASFLLSMTILPALAARLGRAVDGVGWWRHGVKNDRLTRGYERLIDFVLARPLVGIGAALCLPVLGFWGAAQLHEQFFPPAERDMFQVQLRLPDHATIEQTQAVVQRAEDTLDANRRVASTYWFLGDSAPQFYYNVIGGEDDRPNFAQAIIQLDSNEGVLDVIQQIQRDLEAAIPEAQVLALQLEQGPPFDAPIEVKIFGSDPAMLATISDEVRRVLSGVPDVITTRSTNELARPQLMVELDDDEARLSGLDNRAVAEQLNALFSGATGGSLLEGVEELPVRIRLSDDARRDYVGLESVDVFAAGSSESIPLAALGGLTLKPEPAVIERENGRRLNRVFGYVTAGVLPAVPNGVFNQRLAAGAVDVPAGYAIEQGGASGERDRAVNNLFASVALLMVLIAASLILSFNSFRLAGVIGVVGLASVGLGMGALFLFGYPFGFMAIVGTMGLIGVAINDSIVVLAALREDEGARRGDLAATRRVVLKATRHVLSTTLTTVAGFMPLILAGGGFWPPLAIAISGGVVGATLLGLTFIPCAFVLLHRQRRPRGEAEAESSPDAGLLAAAGTT